MKEYVINKINDKKELRGVNDEIVERLIKKYLTPEVKKIIEEERYRNSSFKEFVKEVRAELRILYGVYQNTQYDRGELAEEEEWVELLKSHKSSSERLDYYKRLYETIFEITGEPGSIIDVGCGMNPISCEFMNLSDELEYLALDISEADLRIVQEYFDKKKKIHGETRFFDALTNEFNFSREYDLCFAFKLFEILEGKKGHELTEEVFKKLPAEWIVASFPTKTLSQRDMTYSRRKWFELMLERLEKEFKIIEASNEIFYVVKKE